VAENISGPEEGLVGSTSIEHTLVLKLNRPHAMERVLHIGTAQPPNPQAVKSRIAGEECGAAKCGGKRVSSGHPS